MNQKTKKKNQKNIHREWLQQLQPEGLVVTPSILDTMGFYINSNMSEARVLLDELISIEKVSIEHQGQNIARLFKQKHERFFGELLEWNDSGGNELHLLSGSKLGAQRQLGYKVPDYDETLRPTYALYELDPSKQSNTQPAKPKAYSITTTGSLNRKKTKPAAPKAEDTHFKDLTPRLIIVHIEGDRDLDAKRRPGKKNQYWDETHHNRFERLLRELDIPAGLLMNDLSIRLVYAPKGESSGYITFTFAHLLEASGRHLLSALIMLLRGPCLLESEKNSLHNALKKSRKHQNTISTQLSHQVLDSFWTLLRGFETAHMSRGEGEAHQAFRELAHTQPKEIYEGILTSIMRLIFLIYVEEEGLIQDDDQSAIYVRSYSITGLFHKLEADRARFQGSMTERRGAWAQILSLTRMIYGGGEYKGFKVPVRQGELFDPERFPFLEGRKSLEDSKPGEPGEQGEQTQLPIHVPPISDECIYRVLQNLLVLKGERLSYRALGVEEIGSVYESMMGYDVECAETDSIVLKPKDVVIRLDHLLEIKGASRKKWLENQAEVKFSGSKTDKEKLKLLQNAGSEDELFDALKHKLSKRGGERLVKGSLYLQPGEERRRSGSHYTPRALSNPVVSRALEPHLKKIDGLDIGKRAEAILKLKICDPAMGSGAFLVEACRQLADALVDAWHKAGTLLEEVGSEEAVLKARRIVAQRCLYGVDKNPYAVSLAKLSLWLFTLSKEESFSFLDHALRCGDSLVGVSNEALSKMQWIVEEEKGQLGFDFTKSSIGEAFEARVQLMNRTATDWDEMSALLEQSREATYELKVIANALVAVFFGQEKKQREKERYKLAGLVRDWVDCKADGKGKDAEELFAPFEMLADSLGKLERAVMPFHWGIEFPEVFAKGGFHSFVGNPPFMGKNTLINSHHNNYLAWLKLIHEGAHGNADLVAHFFRKTYALLRYHGSLGLVSTNTISQGDTRTTGLTWLCKNEAGVIYDSNRRKVWPGDAGVIISTVHLIKRYVEEDNVSLKIDKKLDGKIVENINAFLTPSVRHESPVPLLENYGKSFVGSYISGIGFIFDDSNKSTSYNQTGLSAIGTTTNISDIGKLIKKNFKNQERIFPYIGGKELNTDPSHLAHRYIINFEDMNEHQARHWPLLMDIVERKVKPERDKNKRGIRKKYWWRYAETAPKLYQSIKGMTQITARSLTSTHFTFTLLDNTSVYDQTLIIFAMNSYASFCCLMSSLHESWSNILGATLGDGPRYSIKNCFETFPFPKAWQSNPALEEAGQAYYEFRAKLMADQSTRGTLMNGLPPEGMTKTYNHFHNPSCNYDGILQLRELHQAMDEAVKNAYEWTELTLDYDWIDHHSGLLLTERIQELIETEEKSEEEAQKAVKPRYTFTPDTKDAIMGRLLDLNAQRAAEEAKAEAKTKPKKTRKTKKNTTKPKTPSKSKPKPTKTKSPTANHESKQENKPESKLGSLFPEENNT